MSSIIGKRVVYQGVEAEVVGVYSASMVVHLLVADSDGKLFIFPVDDPHSEDGKNPRLKHWTPLARLAEVAG